MKVQDLLWLLEVSAMPTLQLLIITVLGAFMATSYLNLLPPDAQKSLNKIVFSVFTPALVFSSLAKTVRFQDIISWWFMPVNIGLTFLVGGALGWVASKLLKLEPYLHNLVIATCATGNLGNVLLILVPAICKENGNPFGDKNTCQSVGLSYATFSMALGNFYIWTYSYNLIRRASENYPKLESEEKTLPLLQHDNDSNSSITTSTSTSTWRQIGHQLLQELKAPPIFAAIIGFIFGAVSWLRNLIIGPTAPLRVINDSIELLGDGTIPCVTLILGGNLTQGISKAKVKASTIIAVICVRYILSPAAGLGIVKAAGHFGFLPSDPLYHFILMIQFTLPPAMSIGTMVQLFQVAKEECSVIFLWAYLVAALALTAWSTVFMWILS